MHLDMSEVVCARCGSSGEFVAGSKGGSIPQAIIITCSECFFQLEVNVTYEIVGPRGETEVPS